MEGVRTSSANITEEIQRSLASFTLKQWYSKEGVVRPIGIMNSFPQNPCQVRPDERCGYLDGKRGDFMFVYWVSKPFLIPVRERKRGFPFREKSQGQSTTQTCSQQGKNTIWRKFQLSVKRELRDAFRIVSPRARKAAAAGDDVGRT